MDAANPALIKRWQKAFEVYLKSRYDKKLKEALLTKMPLEFYDLWDGLCMEVLFEGYDRLDPWFKISFLIFLWFSDDQVDIKRKGLLCPTITMPEDNVVRVFNNPRGKDQQH